MAKILVIDDDASVIEALRIALEKLGHEVVTVRDGREGIKKFREAPADLVITDLLMPNHDGFETIRDFRKEFPAAPIIAISGGGQMSPALYLDMAEHLGASLTLKKPFSVDELDTAISQVLRG